MTSPVLCPALILAVLMSLLPTLSAKTVDEMKKEGWRLTFSDEFDGAQLDSGKWKPHYNFSAIVNNEMQAYVPGAFTVDHGLLHITARHQAAVQDGHTQAYTSGVMTTSGKFSQRYGWFEIRCRVPKGQGFWPAFWLLSDSGQWPPEIDIFENLGHENHIMHFTNHWRDSQGQNQGKSQQTTGADYTANFHTIAVDWQPDRIVWYVDDQEQCRVTDHIPQEAMYLIANLAVGGDWPKAPDATTPFPSSFDIDYIRVYQEAKVP